MSESETTAGASWVARLAHRTAAGESHTFLGRAYASRELAELTAQCWWATGYGRRGVVAIHVRDACTDSADETNWAPVGPGAKDACYLLGAVRPRTAAPGTLHLVAFRALREQAADRPPTDTPGIEATSSDRPSGTAEARRAALADLRAGIDRPAPPTPRVRGVAAVHEGTTTEGHPLS
jgi:hypothetical protein